MKWSILLFAALAAAGCAGTLQDRIDHDGLAVTRGMTIQKAFAILGPPEVDYQGTGQLRYYSRFWKPRLFLTDDAEWVWLRRDPVVVLWTRGDVITAMGTLPRASALDTRRPEAPAHRCGQLPRESPNSMVSVLVGAGQMVNRQRDPYREVPPPLECAR